MCIIYYNIQSHTVYCMRMCVVQRDQPSSTQPGKWTQTTTLIRLLVKGIWVLNLELWRCPCPRGIRQDRRRRLLKFFKIWISILLQPHIIIHGGGRITHYIFRHVWKRLYMTVRLTVINCKKVKLLLLSFRTRTFTNRFVLDNKTIVWSLIQINNNNNNILLGKDGLHYDCYLYENYNRTDCVWMYNFQWELNILWKPSIARSWQTVFSVIFALPIQHNIIIMICKYTTARRQFMRTENHFQRNDYIILSQIKWILFWWNCNNSNLLQKLAIWQRLKLREFV